MENRIQESTSAETERVERKLREEEKKNKRMEKKIDGNKER